MYARLFDGDFDWEKDPEDVKPFAQIIIDHAPREGDHLHLVTHEPKQVVEIWRVIAVHHPLYRVREGQTYGGVSGLSDVNLHLTSVGYIEYGE